MEKRWMNKYWFFVLAPVGLAVFVWLGGTAVKLLWNWLLPAMFGWPPLTFWQALGLLALCRILFGGFGAHGLRSRRRRLTTERWERMTPEEREKCRRWFHGRCGGEVPPDPAPGT
jgi:hypothetical protein